MTAGCAQSAQHAGNPADKRAGHHNAPGYLTDGEILNEIADITEHLTSGTAFLTGEQRQEADERRTALAGERAARRRARNTRNDDPRSQASTHEDPPRARQGQPGRP